MDVPTPEMPIWANESYGEDQHEGVPVLDTARRAHALSTDRDVLWEVNGIIANTRPEAEPG